VRGHLCKPPRYYLGAYELTDSVGARRVKARRKRAARPEDSTPERLRVREACAVARLNSLRRDEL